MDALPAPDPLGLSVTRELLPRARAGDREAQGALLARYQQALERFLRSRMPRGAALEARDVVQEVFARVLATIDRVEYHGVGAFWSYLRTIASRYLVDVARGAARRGGDASLTSDSYAAPAATGPGPIATLLSAEQVELFDRAVERLSERSRAALLMRVELDLDFASIASELGFPSPDAARMAVSRAIDRVAEEMSRDGRAA